jgi:hypothetical protein
MCGGNRIFQVSLRPKNRDTDDPSRPTPGVLQPPVPRGHARSRRVYDICVHASASTPPLFMKHLDRLTDT